MTDTTTPDNGWTFITIGGQNVPVHCRTQALDLDLGERDIPGWPVRRPTIG